MHVSDVPALVFCFHRLLLFVSCSLFLPLPFFFPVLVLSSYPIRAVAHLSHSYVKRYSFAALAFEHLLLGEHLPFS